LHISAAYIGLLGELLLGEVRGITQAIDALAEGLMFGLAHPSMIEKLWRMTAKNASPFATVATKNGQNTPVPMRLN
jgi:hypothetical protein